MILAIIFIAVLVIFEITSKESKIEIRQTKIRSLKSDHRNAA
jgi:hypothetical protein